MQYLLWQLICWNQVKKIDDLVINLKEMPHLVKFSFMNFPQTDKIILSRNMQLIPDLIKNDLSLDFYLVLQHYSARTQVKL